MWRSIHWRQQYGKWCKITPRKAEEAVFFRKAPRGSSLSGETAEVHAARVYEWNNFAVNLWTLPIECHGWNRKNMLERTGAARMCLDTHGVCQSKDKSSWSEAVGAPHHIVSTSCDAEHQVSLDKQTCTWTAFLRLGLQCSHFLPVCDMCEETPGLKRAAK